MVGRANLPKQRISRLRLEELADTGVFHTTLRTKHARRETEAAPVTRHDGVHFLRCEAQQESRLRLRLDYVNVATARALNHAMHSCIRRAQPRRSVANFTMANEMELMAAYII